MAQAQLNPQLCNSKCQRVDTLPSAPKQFFISISPELTLKVRQKSGELVILFYYRNMKSFSLPVPLFLEVISSSDIISLATQLIQGDIAQLNHGGVIFPTDGPHNVGHCEQF